MPGRRPLKGGAPRLLGSHAGHEGKVYRAVFDALVAEYGPFSELGKLEAGRVAAAWVQLKAATSALATAQRARRLGRGRRPDVRAIERLARRQGLADSSFSTALERLKGLTSDSRRRRTPISGAELAARAGGMTPRRSIPAASPVRESTPKNVHEVSR